MSKYEVMITRTSLYEVEAPDADEAITLALSGEIEESPGGETTGAEVLHQIIR